MMLAILWSFLLAMFRFLLADGMWGALTEATKAHWAAHQVPFVVNQPLRHAVAAGDSLVVLSGKGNQRSLVVTTPKEGDKTLAALTLPSPSGPEAFVARGGGWWYVTNRWHFDRPATLFIGDDGSGTIATNVVDDPVADRTADSWFEVRGDRPRAMITYAGGGRIEAVEIDRHGPLATWRLPLAETISNTGWAEMLPDGRIALLAHDQRKGSSLLLLLGQAGRVDSIELDTMVGGSMVTAVDASGNIAVVGGGANCILGTVIAPGAARPIVWQLLTDVADAVTVPSPVSYVGSDEIRVVAVRGGFVAAWVTHPGTGRPRLEARELRAGSIGMGPIAVGEPSTSHDVFVHETFFDMHEDGGDLAFYWDDGRNLVSRRLPFSISGYQLVEWLGELCGHWQ